MRDRFPGYYRPSEEEFEQLWNEALIVPDTNVLLTLYRLSEATRTKLLEILDRLQTRLFVPYQVAFEFQGKRIDVIEEQTKAYENVEKEIAGFAAQVGKGMRQHPRLDKADLEKRIDKALAPVAKHLEELRAGHPDPLGDEDPLGPDSIRDALDSLIAERIGEPRDLTRLTEEGMKRYEAKQPPGWKDADKPEPDRYGDLAIWFDVLDRADKEKKPIILVTEERKPDWWWIRDGRSLGPQRQLVEEMNERTGQRLYLYGLERFMAEATKAFDIDFSEDERDDVARAETATRSPARANLFELWREDPEAFSWPVKTEGLKPDLWNSYLANLALNSALFSSGEADGHWTNSVEAAGKSALLKVDWNLGAYRISAPVNRLICVVRGPDNDRFVASRRDTSLKAAFRFPDNFAGEGEIGPGTYRYAWHFASASGDRAAEIASGEFELTDDG